MSSTAHSSLASLRAELLAIKSQAGDKFLPSEQTMLDRLDSMLAREAYVPPAGDDKVARLLERIQERAEALSGNQHMLTVLHDTVRALDRIRGREEKLADAWERVEIAQSGGSILEFTGRKIAGTSYQANGRQPGTVTYELWETREGVWIAATLVEPERGRSTASALQVPAELDPDRRRFACMEHWGWNDRARSMVRKLGWTLREDVA